VSHPLGSLADNLATYAIYATAQAEMRRAYTLIDAADYLAAAAEIDSAARAAAVLANASAGVAGERVEHWHRVAGTRRRFAERVRAHVAQLSTTQPQLVAA